MKAALAAGCRKHMHICPHRLAQTRCNRAALACIGYGKHDQSNSEAYFGATLFLGWSISVGRQARGWAQTGTHTRISCSARCDHKLAKLLRDRVKSWTANTQIRIADNDVGQAEVNSRSGKGSLPCWKSY